MRYPKHLRKKYYVSVRANTLLGPKKGKEGLIWNFVIRILVFNPVLFSSRMDMLPKRLRAPAWQHFPEWSPIPFILESNSRKSKELYQEPHTFPTADTQNMCVTETFDEHSYLNPKVDWRLACDVTVSRDPILLYCNEIETHPNVSLKYFSNAFTNFN